MAITSFYLWLQFSVCEWWFIIITLFSHYIIKQYCVTVSLWFYQQACSSDKIFCLIFNISHFRHFDSCQHFLILCIYISYFCLTGLQSLVPDLCEKLWKSCGLKQCAFVWKQQIWTWPGGMCRMPCMHVSTGLLIAITADCHLIIHIRAGWGICTTLTFSCISQATDFRYIFHNEVIASWKTRLKKWKCVQLGLICRFNHLKHKVLSALRLCQIIKMRAMTVGYMRS